ncbi:MAG TPA: hypothetical protein VNT23_07170 [Gaiellaceae bacterium]|nr:hypothetical protein [Gaiellaceae bacterium]
MAAKGLGVGAVWGLLKEARVAAEDVRPLLVSGVLADKLAQELGRGGAPGAVATAGRAADAAVLVRVLAGEPTPGDEAELRAAGRAGVPVIAVQTSGAESGDVPYVLATDVVVCPPGSGFPVEAILRAVADRLGEHGTSLAARLPALREPLCAALTESFARKNGILGAAIFVPGADFPVLTLNQLRLVLRIAAAHGVEVDQSRLPEIAATVGAGIGLRAAARRALLSGVPVAGWMVKGAVAYAGTRAVGEAAQRYFAALAARP